RHKGGIDCASVLLLSVTHTVTPEISTLSLHDALPISQRVHFAPSDIDPGFKRSGRRLNIKGFGRHGQAPKVRPEGPATEVQYNDLQYNGPQYGGVPPRFKDALDKSPGRAHLLSARLVRSLLTAHQSTGMHP